ncbi:MAG: sulfotransferase, partial [Oscillospiraceae bacterium]|nr:sulfotransferase [Oscillospiraceae bacterium]
MLVEIIKEKLLRQSAHQIASTSRHLFIGGAARSGTTMLQSVLCSSEASNPMIPEVAPIRIVLEEYVRQITYLDGHNSLPFLEEARVLQNARSHLHTILSGIRNRFNCNKVVVKEPALTPYFPLLHKMLGQDVCFVYIVRDPRDTMASMRRWGEKLPPADDHPFRTFNMRELCELFLQYYNSPFDFDESFKDSLTSLRYEDFVQDPQRLAQLIGESVSLNLDRFDPTVPWDEAEFWNKESTGVAQSEHYTQPISNKSVGNYLNRFSLHEIQEIESQCQSFFKAFNYSFQMEQDLLPATKMAGATPPSLFIRSKRRFFASQYLAIRNDLPNIKVDADEYRKI